MASKLFAPFKKFPQQLPIFKKSTDKFKDVTMSNYNSVYGMPDDITCNSFDHDLHLLALGTKKGEIKIYGSPGMVYTLVNSPLKSVSFLKFLDGQGRIISINSDNEVVLWEYKTESSIWEITSTISLSTDILNGKVTSLDVSRSFSWKSDSDDVLELLIIGSSANKIIQILIIGSRFHLYDGNDLTIDSDYLLEKCQNLNKDYDFGGVNQISFHPTENEKILVSYKNGLLLILETNVTKEVIEEVNNETKEVVNETVEPKENEDKLEVENEVAEELVKQPEINEEDKSPETKETGENEKEASDEQNESSEKTAGEAVKSETEKVIEEIPKSETKPEIKILKKSVQVPFAFVRSLSIVNYVLTDKKVNSICWDDNKIKVINDESGCINLYEINSDNLKITEPDQVIILPENFQSYISKLSYFNLKGDNVGAFVTSVNEKQHLLVFMKDDKVFTEIEIPSHIIDYIVVKGHVSDDAGDSQPRILLILCETQLIGIDLECENFTEIQCPYLVLKNTSPITSVTSIIQAPALLFSSTQTINEVFKDWPLKTESVINEKIDEETSIDIIGTGHADGSINIWQVMQAGILSLLTKIESSDIFNTTSDTTKAHIDLSSRKQVGHRLIESEDNILQITNLQLMLHCTNSFSESSSNELFCVAGNFSGTVLIFKYDGSDGKENIIEISSEFDKEGLTWVDSEAPELLNKSDISQKLPKLNYIVRLNPSLPVTALAFQPSWDLLAAGCTYGLVLVDFRQNKCVFSHLTVHRASKNNNVVQPPLTVGQQLKKSIRQSFRKLKKLKPAAKHTYTVNEEKSKDKEENKPIEKEEDKETPKPEEDEELQKETQQITEDAEINEEKAKEEAKDNIEENDNAIITNENVVESVEAELSTMEISRKDKPLTTVGSLLIVHTNLTSSNKIPCLFAGTNIGAIFAFEITFEEDTEESVAVKLSKELHLQHKAPILLMLITNSNHVPLIGSVDQIGSFQRKFKTTDELKNDEEKSEEITDESKAAEIEIGPSGDADCKDDSKLKCGTLPSPVVQEDIIEPPEGARRSVDSSKDKINLTNVNMKKSGTLPASFLQAIGKSQGSSDSHELLVVSEEQVKLFNLPSLKAKYKYKVVDTGHHFSHSKAASSQESEQDKKNDVNNEVPNEPVTPKPVMRRISSVGLCKMRGLKSTGNKWSVAIALTNGEIIALQLANLKKYLSNVYNYSTSHILAAISNGELNLIISYAYKSNIQITDFSQANIHRYEPYVSISLPKAVRPVIEEKVEVEAKPDETVEEAKSDPSGTELIVNGHHHDQVNGLEEDEEKDQMGDEAVVQNASAVHHGDITMDSIKEYITNVDGNVTIKTFESTKEKQITVDGGQIVTTIHEKQIKDGEIIKDDVVKITSDTRASEELSLKE